MENWDQKGKRMLTNRKGGSVQRTQKKMKITVIGANGRLGSKVVEHALKQGYTVVAIDLGEPRFQGQCDVRSMSLFDMKEDDLTDSDAIISAFGSGLHGDPTLNKKAFEKYIQLCTGHDRYLVAIAGAGCLYTDETHAIYEYQSPNHPEKLREISRNNLEGIQCIKKHFEFGWCIVCPSRLFDFDGPDTGEYLIGDKEEILYNEDGNSYVSYEDLASAMLAIAQARSHCHQVVTIASKKGGK